MAKFQIFSALVLSGLAATAFAVETTVVVEGKVYCDNCRAGFETTISEYISGASVKLECRNATTNKLIHSVEGVTDASGTYRLEVVDDHDEKLCEVVLVSSPNENCSEIKEGRDRAGIVVAANGGMISNVRHANSLGFLGTEPLALCGDLLAQYNLGEA